MFFLLPYLFIVLSSMLLNCFVSLQRLENCPCYSWQGNKLWENWKVPRPTTSIGSTSWNWREAHHCKHSSHFNDIRPTFWYIRASNMTIVLYLITFVLLNVTFVLSAFHRVKATSQLSWEKKKRRQTTRKPKRWVVPFSNNQTLFLTRKCQIQQGKK